MNVLVVCQYFYPEEFKVNELVEDLVQRGHNVTVLTGKPTYPKGSYPKGYKFWGIQRENYKGAKVIRVPELTRGNGGTIGVIKSMISFLFSSSIFAKTIDLSPDVVICFQLSPVTMANAALIYSKRSNAKLIHWVQDLWPESVTATTPIKKGIIISLLRRYVSKIYRQSDYILVQSKAFIESICAKGNFKSKIIFAPNWAENIFTSPIQEKYIDLKIQLGEKDFKIMFAGNIGEAQDFDNILQAASLTKKMHNIKWIIVGDGRYRETAEKLVYQLDLSETVFFVGRYSVDYMPSIFTIADAMLVTLKDEPIFSLTIPSKTQAYMASGKPILTMLNGEGSNVVLKAKCGLTANAGDYKKLAENAVTMSQMSQAEITEMGENGRIYYNMNFDKKIIIDKVDNLIMQSKF